MTDSEFIERTSKEFKSAANLKFWIELDAKTAFCLIANLQLALRHPGNTGNPARAARTFIDALKQNFRESGLAAHVELIERGDDPKYDYEWLPKAGHS